MDTSKRRCRSRQRGKTKTHKKKITNGTERNRSVCVFTIDFENLYNVFRLLSSAGGEEGGERKLIQTYRFLTVIPLTESTLSPSSMVRGGSGWLGPKVDLFGCRGLPAFVWRVPPIISHPARNHPPTVSHASPHAINLISCVCARADVDPPREPGPANQTGPLISTDPKTSQLGSHHPTIPIATQRLHRSRRQTSRMPILPRAQPLIHPPRFSFTCVPSARSATRWVG